MIIFRGGVRDKDGFRELIASNDRDTVANYLTPLAETTGIDLVLLEETYQKVSTTPFIIKASPAEQKEGET